jgi:hypothetical protein
MVTKIVAPMVHAATLCNSTFTVEVKGDTRHFSRGSGSAGSLTNK